MGTEDINKYGRSCPKVRSAVETHKAVSMDRERGGELLVGILFRLVMMECYLNEGEAASPRSGKQPSRCSKHRCAEGKGWTIGAEEGRPG